MVGDVGVQERKARKRKKKGGCMSIERRRGGMKAGKEFKNLGIGEATKGKGGMRRHACFVYLCSPVPMATLIGLRRHGLKGWTMLKSIVRFSQFLIKVLFLFPHSS